MHASSLSSFGRHLLDRRAFLQATASGLGGIALASLLGEERALADDSPIRPVIQPAAPLAPRHPHHSPKARRAL